MSKRKIVKRVVWSVLTIFLLFNILAFFHAWKFTHFSDKKFVRTLDPKQLSIPEKIKAVFTGVDNPRPVNDSVPHHPFETIYLEGPPKTACWMIKADSGIGTVVLFHGYGGKKSDMINRSEEFLKMGYHTLLVDFMGSGESEGNQTTIGYKEAIQVKTCYDYLVKKGETNIYILGTSMGAVAILKCVHDYRIKPSGIILECPFGSMYQTVCARFNMMHVPVFPMAGLLVFWGGIQNGFWAFDHNPVDYAKEVDCPTLLLYGEQDEKVSRGEIDQIFLNLKGNKILKTYPLAGHENYLLKYKERWVHDVEEFIHSQKN